MRISDWSSDVCSSDLAIVGEVARTYFNLRGLQESLRVARENADNQRETLRLVDARLDAGRGHGIDTARPRAKLETTQASMPEREAQVAIEMPRLDVLVGKTKSEERRGGNRESGACRYTWS